MLRCAVFDFDGTLVLSNHIKHDTFFSLAERFPGGRAVMAEIHAQPSPGDRYAIWASFAARMGARCGRSDTDVWAAGLAAEYTVATERAILACDDRAGALPLLHALHRAGIALYVNSATPTSALVPVVLGRGLDRLFRGILGGPATKAANLRQIMAAEGVVPAEMLMVGDGIDDCQGAVDVGCVFLAVAGGTLPGGIDALDDYRDFAAKLAKEFPNVPTV